ncbi:branched-chain amino acid ABC transporter substrate-binding protein [Oceanisphaera profunda]|uniref:Branched-chain amino acid ABC transporter substrate-binding protein n=2 Tax=Oceanisphaera profunda TaxID=1416627 RepID=A0A1Y0D6D1_9GAMM|nr:branched-chain amino acid ABC transporter substrate-binding protein [Oceanisphaera profunda]
MRYRRWLMASLLCLSGPTGALELSPQEMAGKQLFLHGSGSGDSIIQARVGAAGSLLPASVMPCASCHGADGRGRPEGGVRPPSILWRRLTLSYGGRLSHGRTRPAYDEQTFARAVVEGRDSAGKLLNPSMPRFVMSQRDMNNLTAYLKRLEEDDDFGLEGDKLRIGSLLPLTGSWAEMGTTVEAVLEEVLARINDNGGIHGRRLELIILDSGETKASAEAALDELQQQGPFFSLLAPLETTLEEGLTEWAEAMGIPLIGPLGPQVEYRQSAMVFHPLAGLRDQLLTLGEFAGDMLPASERTALIAYSDQAHQRELAESLAEKLRRSGWLRVQLLDSRQQKETIAVTAATNPALFFIGASEDFVDLAERWHASGLRPYLFAASGQVAGEVFNIPNSFSERVFLAYPFLPSDWSPAGASELAQIREKRQLSGRTTTLQVQAYCAAVLLVEGLKRAGRDASRKKLVVAIEALYGFNTGLSPALNFGPGKRVGAVGAHVVTVDLEYRRFRPLGPYLRIEDSL